MEINTSYLSDHNTYRTNNPEYIVVHNTDNFSEGADARAHAYAQFHGNLSGTSVHFYTDDKGIAYQTAELQRGCWHVGVNYGGKLFGTVNNRNSIGVEMCVQKGYDFEKAFENTVELLKTLLRMTGISPEHVVQHYDVCLKNCPSQIRKKNAWKRLQQEIGVPDNAALGQGCLHHCPDRKRELGQAFIRCRTDLPGICKKNLKAVSRQKDTVFLYKCKCLRKIKNTGGKQ